MRSSPAPLSLKDAVLFFVFLHELCLDFQQIALFVLRNCDKPRLIEALKTKRIRDIACGSSHSAAITSSGELYSWGLGEYGRLGHGDNTTQLRPKLVCVKDSLILFHCTFEQHKAEFL